MSILSKLQALLTAANATTGESNTTLTDAVQTLVDGYGQGGGSSELSNIATVTDSEIVFGYFLSAIKNNNIKCGTITYNSAFTNTEQLILETGLTELHGFLFAATDHKLIDGISNAQSNQFVIVSKFSTEEPSRYFIFGQGLQNQGKSEVNRTFGTAYASQPENGTIRIDGGNVYFTGRYNQNANYQLVYTNMQYDWIAW